MVLHHRCRTRVSPGLGKNEYALDHHDVGAALVLGHGAPLRVHHGKLVGALRRFLVRVDGREPRFAGGACGVPRSFLPRLLEAESDRSAPYSPTSPRPVRSTRGHTQVLSTIVVIARLVAGLPN